MLQTLYIKDFALIDKLTVEFQNGFNIITGETGAGKSIILGAMGLLLGERASTESIRKGAKKTVIEGIFEVGKNESIAKLLDKNEIESDSELIVRREISAKGSSRAFLNDTPITLSILKEAGDYLIDLHGQHEHQSLLRSETHVNTLDEFGDYLDIISAFKSERKKLLAKYSELEKILKNESILKEKKELHEFQINEIDAVSPVEGEEEELEEKLIKLENSEKLTELSSTIYSGIYENENSVYDQLNTLRNYLDELSVIDKQFAEKLGECDSAIALVDDIAQYTLKYQDSIEADPHELENIRERLGAINLLKKKYGGSVKSLLEYRIKIGAEFHLAENYADKISEVKNEIEDIRSGLANMGKKLTKERKKNALEVQKLVVDYLADLGIPNAKFLVNFSSADADANEKCFVLLNDKKIRFNENGLDDVEFMISTNIGEDPKSLAKIASGGEISRIMLAMKSVLAKNEKLPLLVFDEIDTGVSGRIAQKVGVAMKSLASHHQIIAITHLPQIAGLADQHYFVEKGQQNGRVITVIRKLSQNERVTEVAKLLSGEEVSASTIESAKELIASGN